MMRRLGLEGLTKLQCKVATAMWMSKPVVPTEAALHALQIPVISKSKKIISINTAPSYVRTRRLSRANKVCMAPVDTYVGRPDMVDLNQMTLIRYICCLYVNVTFTLVIIQHYHILSQVSHLV